LYEKHQLGNFEIRYCDLMEQTGIRMPADLRRKASKLAKELSKTVRKINKEDPTSLIRLATKKN
jgi:hypothetical protein